MIKRLALLTGLTLALAAPAHAGKRQQANDLNLDVWLELVQTLQTAAATGNISASDATSIAGDLLSALSGDSLFQNNSRNGKKGRKGKRGKKGKAAQAKAQSQGKTQVSASR